MLNFKNLVFTSSSFQALHSPDFLLGPLGKESHPDVAQRAIILELLMEKYSIAKIENNQSLANWIEEIHSENYLHFLASLETLINDEGYHVPTEFSNNFRHDHQFSNYLTELGVYASDTCTPVSKYTWKIARESAICAITAAEHLLNYGNSAIAITRPPGHHAGFQHVNNFCYLNNIAIAANFLAKQDKKVAILDLDFHHGNGTQELFYQRNDVLTISLHADPRNHSPHYSGFEGERGEDNGLGYNKNFVLSDDVTEKEYVKTLQKATELISEFGPDYLCVALGFDIFHNDPIGNWSLTTSCMPAIIQSILSLSLPVLFTLEGGYDLTNISSFEQILHL
jgi:acetoin utilization deacetylase AcuC-like enzyme